MLTAVLLTTTVPAYGGPGIITDGSVGAGQTIAGVNAGAGRFVIPQALGSVVGNNLFHSFSRFNIDTGQMADFTTSTASLANVVSRVTGGTTSQINGTLKLSAAGSSAPAFFFINPAGVVFGAGAAVNVPGAFHISTADYLKFANGDKFYADLRQASTLSSAAPEAFGFLGTTRASIEVRDRGSLAMKPGQPICIVAGDVEIDEATVSTRGGDTRVVAVGKAAQEIGFTGALPATSGELKILNAGTIDSRSTGTKDSGSIAVSAGDITIDTGDGYDYTGIFNLAYPGANAGPVNVRAGSIFIAGQGSVSYPAGIFSQAWYGSGNAGSVEVSTTGSISLVNGGQISADTFSGGNAGNVTVHARSISIDGQGSYVYTGSSYGYTGIFSNAYRGSTGNAGSVEITTAGKLDIKNGGTISADTFGVGNAGSIKVVTAGNLSIDNGGTISSSTWGSGDAGYVEVSAGSIAISNQEKRGTSGIFSTAEPESTGGKAGNVNVTAIRELAIDDGSVSASTASSGDAGTVTINAGSVSIDHAGTIASTTHSSGNAGGVDIEISEAGALSIDNGSRISSSSFGSGNAGNVAVSSGSIAIFNRENFGSSGIFSTVQPNSAGTGKAGNINITAKREVAIDNGAISVSNTSLASGDTGTVTINAGSVSIDHSGLIASNTYSSGNAGGVDIEISEAGALSIDNGSRISSSSFGSGNAGNVAVSSGSIAIFNRENFGSSGIFSTVQPNSAGTGKAGNINITAKREVAIDNGAISVSNTSLAFGDTGTVTINAGSVSIDHSGVIASNTHSSGNAGGVDIEVAETGSLSIDNGGTISSSTWGSGDAGNVKVSAGSIAISNQEKRGTSGIFSTAEPESTGGKAGNINVTAKRDLAIDNGGVSSSTASSGDAGSVTIDAGSISINHFGTVASETSSSGDAGRVKVNAADITLSSGGGISSSTSSSSDAGTVTVNARDITIDGLNQTGFPTGIFSQSIRTDGGPGGLGGDIAVIADTLSIIRFGTISAETASNGRGGSIDLQVKYLALTEGGTINAMTSGTGNAGDIRIHDAEDVRIRGVSDVAFQRAYDNQQVVGQPAGIYLNSQGSGNGGNLQLTTRELTVQDGGLISAVAVDGSVPSLPQTRAGNICIDAGTIVLAGGGAIDASTSGAARAGSITVNADTSIDISGKFDRALHPTITNNPVSDQSHIGSSATYALNKNAKTLGAGGDVTISTPRLTLRNGGQIGVNTEGAGRAGSIGIDAGTLIIDGDSSGINAAAIQGSSGQTGSVTVTANDITLSNNGQISIENNASVDANVASTLSPTSISVTSPRITILNSPHAITTESTGNVAAGDIRISASEKLYLDPSGITTTANDGNGGAIDIRAGQIWLQNSQIATSVLGTTTGNGGDITINADTLIMNTGFIQANTEATNASGGRVSITVNNLAASGNSLFIGGNTPYTYLSSVGIFGFNVIQAAAPTGVSGTVQLSTPSLDVTAGLIGLDTHPITAQVARHLCENSSGSSLVPVGRGGLPPGGADLLSPGQISGIGFVSPPTVALPLLMHASGPMPFHSPCLAAL